MNSLLSLLFLFFMTSCGSGICPSGNCDQGSPYGGGFNEIIVYATPAVVPNFGNRASSSGFCASQMPLGIGQRAAIALVSYTGDEISDFPSTHFVPVGIPLQGVNGVVLEDDFTDLFNSNIDSSIQAVTGTSITSFHTGSTNTGAVTANCADWTDSSGGQSNTAGDATSVGTWISASNPVCSASLPLICLAY